MVAKSVTVLDVIKDLEAPSFSISTVSSKTLCETGPQWVRNLLVSILDATKSTSDNKVTVESSGGRARVKSEVVLRVEINYPGFVPLPIGPMERSGSESMQSLLDQQMAPVMKRFRSDYLRFEAQRSA